MVSQDSTSEFRIAYEGEALVENTMDVRDLAPALIAFGELFTRANTILNGEKISVSLKGQSYRTRVVRTSFGIGASILHDNSIFDR